MNFLMSLRKGGHSLSVSSESLQNHKTFDVISVWEKVERDEASNAVVALADGA